MLLSAAIVAVAVASLTGPPAADWAQPGFGPADSYYNPGESVLNAATVGAVQRRWTTPLRAATEGRCARAAAPVVAAGRVFVPEETGIAAFQAGTGRLSWRFTWDFPEDESTPVVAVADGLLLVGNQGCQSQSDPNGTVRALSTTSGRAVWSRTLPFPVQSQIVDRGIVVVSGESESDGATVLGLRLADGVERWRVAGAQSSGVSAAGRVLISGPDSTSAVAVGTGRTVWTRPVAWTGQSATPAGDRFYVSAGTTLLCVDATTGAVRWTAAGRASTLVAADGRRVYRAAAQGLEALDARTGRRQWSVAVAGYAGQPVRAGGLLYSTVDGKQPLVVLNAADGSRATAGTQFGSGIAGGVVVTGGRVFAVRGDTVSAYGR